MAEAVSWVEGWTQTRRFRLSIDSGAGSAFQDLTGRTFVLVLRDNAGTVINNPGSVAVVTPQTGDDLGAIDYTPTDATVLTNARSPMTAHFKESLAGKDRFWPNEHKGTPMLWLVGRHGG